MRDFSLNSGERQAGITLAEIRLDHIARYQFIIDTLRGNVQKTEQLFGLDAFCATGYGSYMISNQLNCTMLGVDASAEAIEHANKFFSNDRTFYANKHFPFDLPVNKFDFVSCIESLEHVQDCESLVRTLIKALKLGGFMFLSVPNEEQLPLERNPMRFHHKHFVPGEIEKIITNCGAMTVKFVYCQDLYQLQNKSMVSPLADDKMFLRAGDDGQILYYVFEKRQ